MGNNKLDQWMQSVEAMSSIKIDHAEPVFDDAAVTKGENVHGPKLARKQRGSRGLEERQHAVTCRKLVLGIGIATIVLYAAFYALLKSRSDSESIESEIGARMSVLYATPFGRIQLFEVLLLSLVAILTASQRVIASEAVRLDRKKAVEAERVQLLQELCRDTKSDASLAIPVAPFTCIRSPSATGCSAVLDAVDAFIVGNADSDNLESTWVPPVGGGAMVYLLQWRERSEQEWDKWVSSVASEKIGEPYYCTKGNLRTHTAYQFRVRAFSAVSQRWGPWSPPSKPTTVRHGKGGIILRIVRRLVSLVLLDGLALLSLHLWVVFDAITKSRDSDSYGTLIDDERFSRF